MNKLYNVLVFPGGTEIGLEIQRSLANCKEVKLHSAGQDVPNHAPFVFAQHYVVPNVHEPGWLNALNRIVEEQKIDYIFPAHDDVILALAQNTDRVKVRVVTSPLETCLITQSKRETYRYFAGTLPVPTVYESLDAVEKFPVFVKPDRGQGSQDTHVARTRSQLSSILAGGRADVILEYLPGDEYTIDCFSDRDRGLLFCGARQRVRIRNGISMNSRQVHDPRFGQIARTISRKLKLYGAWFFQLKKDAHGEYRLLEIAPRIAGTMAFHRVLGVNFPLLSLYEQERTPLEILVNPLEIEVDRALTNRYSQSVTFRSVYVDLDDTILLKGRVNVSLVRFLFQCINDGKHLVLLTRRAEDLDVTMRRHRLTGLFDEIVRVGPLDEKANHIKDHDSIFIDDSFSERKRVSERLGILTFDCSMIELLRDDRV
jgi:carbamoylphosphate synthase large subunit